jgi:hypothetical protein
MWQKLQTEFREQIWDNEQVLKLRQKFSELDTQTQSYIIIGSFAAFVLFLLATFFTLWGKTISVKNQIAEMETNIQYVQKAAVKIDELRSQAQLQGVEPLLEGIDANAPLAAFLERASLKSLIAKGNVEVGASTGGAAELKLNKISLTQLVRVLFIVENAGAGATVEKLNVDAKDDTEGYLWATMLVRKAGS